LLSCIASGRASRATPHGFPCVSPLLPRKSHLSVLTVFVRTDVPAFPLRPWGRQLHFLNYEATFRFAHAATRRSVRLETEFARPTKWAFVKELRVLGYPSFKLHGRTAEFPWSRFTGQVMRLTRHTDVVEFFHLVRQDLGSDISD
jgi:hypothetical protein